MNEGNTRIRLPCEIPTDLEAGLARHDYHYRNWRWADDSYTIVYYQFRRLRDAHTESIWTPGVPYEWTLDEAYSLLRQLDAKRPYAQRELEL